MTRVLMVSNGPSAKKWDQSREGYDITVGVCKAAIRWPFDWWVFSDTTTFANHMALGDPKLFTRHKTVATLGLEYPEPIGRMRDMPVFFVEDVRFPKPSPDSDWPPYSGLLALRLLLHLKRESGDRLHADLYGFDMGGSTDFTGAEGTSRNPNRWKAERQAFWGHLQILEEYGVTVERLGCDA